MSRIMVKTAGRPFPCEVGDPGLCRYCGGQIIWGTTPRGKAIPLGPWPAGAGETESHFAHCSRRIGSEPPPPSPPRRDYRRPAHGVEMSETIWRKLIQLIHPDRHNGSQDEALATEMTQWLLQQRARLIQEEDKQA